MIEILPLALFTLPTPGQGIVSPAHFATAEATVGNGNPIGALAPQMRFLQIHEDLPVGPVTLHGMSFRRNADGDALPAFSVDMSIVCSGGSTIVSAAAPSATFDDNHARLRTTVLAQQTVSFPAVPVVSAVPAPFTYSIAFDQPLQVSRRVVWDMRISGRTNSVGIVLDADDGSSTQNPLPAIAAFGRGCVASGRTVGMVTNGTAQMDWPNGRMQLAFGANEGPAGAPVVVSLGFSTGSLNGLPLPLLIPGTGSGTSGPCFAYNDMVVTFPGTCNAAGAMSTPLRTFSAGSELHGLSLYHQVFALDPSANAFGLVASDTMMRHLVAPYSPSAVGQVGATTGANAITGLANGNRGTIVEFR
ncbi:MAG: hypothetical protein R3F56_02185 [Planctomycetota bacterium]